MIGDVPTPPHPDEAFGGYSQEAAASMLLALKMTQRYADVLPPVVRALIDLAISKAEGRSNG